MIDSTSHDTESIILWSPSYPRHVSKKTFDLDIVCDFYGDDFDKELLTARLHTLGVHYQQVRGQTGEDTSSNLDMKTYLLSLSPG